MHITEAARRLSVTAGYLRLLERAGQIPPARRDLNGRIYTRSISLFYGPWGSAPAPTNSGGRTRYWRGYVERGVPCHTLPAPQQFTRAGTSCENRCVRFALECFHRRKGQEGGPTTAPDDAKGGSPNDSSAKGKSSP